MSRRRLTGPRGSLWRSEEGAAAPVMALMLLVLVGITGFAIDVGHVMWVQRQLQTAADAAALAGAQDVYENPGSAVSLANSYSASAGGKNVFLTSAVSTSAVMKCLNSVTFPTCSAAAGTYNALQITEQSTVSMWFSQVLGVKPMVVKAQATASAKGGASKALDIMVVLDTTASMNSADHNCSGGSTRIACAKFGVQALLSGLNPAIDRVGIIVFPGYSTASQASSQATCTPGHSGIAKYGPYSAISPPYYLVASLDNSYMSSAGAKSLNASSSVVTAAGGGSCGTSGGVQAIGGVGTDYGQAIIAAMDSLLTDGNAKTQKVIVLLSDGDANASGNNITGGLNPDNQCQQAVAAGQAASLQGIWVYSIAYGAATKGSCSTDKGDLGVTVVSGQSVTVNGKGKSACWALQNIASDAGKFYSDAANGCVGTAGNDKDLVALFKSIAASLTQPRLIPNNST